MNLFKVIIYTLSLLICVLPASSEAANLKKLKSSCKEKQIMILGAYSDFEAEVVRWIGKCVKSNSLKNAKPVRRELKLVKNNDSLMDTWNKVKNMQGHKVAIQAKYIGANKVNEIAFTPRGYEALPVTFEGDVVLVESLMKKRWQTKTADIIKGELFLSKLMKITKNKAKAIASMPENPVGTPGAGEIVSLLRSAHPKNLAKYTVGGLIDVLTANQAGKVARARSLLYESYSNGVVKVLDDSYRAAKNATQIEKAFYQLGLKQARKLNPIERHQLRVFLIESHRTFSFKGYNPIEPTLSYFESKYHGSVFQKSMMNFFTDSDYRYR